MINILLFLLLQVLYIQSEYTKNCDDIQID